jgi:hypothetical protein
METDGKIGEIVCRTGISFLLTEFKIFLPSVNSICKSPKFKKKVCFTVLKYF